MTSTDVAVREVQTSVVLSNEQLKYISNTEFVPKGLRGNLPAILACVATGRAIGVDDMTAIRNIHIIDGKPTFAAELMVMLVRKAGHSITGTVGDGVATVKGKRADNGDEMVSEWTMAMAERAGLKGKSSWVKYPEAMLWARAVSQLCRMLFADCFAGGTYTSEELDGDFTESAAVAPAGDPADDPSEASGASEAAAASGGEPGITEAQRKKANVLVGKLREAGHITTEQLWDAMRPAAMFDRPDELHWGFLRDTLTRAEATGLIDRLVKLEETVAAQEAAVDAAAESSFKVPEGAA